MSPYTATHTYNAQGFSEYEGDAYLELVAEFMGCGMSQDDAEIRAADELEERREMAANESPGAELEEREGL